MKHGKQIRKKKRIKNNQGGFTLAELLIALGILAILLSIGMIALVHYQRSLKLTEMDSSAKEIFVAAQNHITAAKASGKWSELSSMHSSDAEAYFGSRMQNAPSDYPDEAAWPENGEGNGHEYHYVIYNGSESTLDNTILDTILPYGSIDEEIRSEGCYVIEYDYETASVYGVFYTDDSKKFSYENDIMGESGLDASGGREDSPEGKEARKNYQNDRGRIIIGYYGGAAAERLKTTKLDKLEIQVKNGDTLEVNITDPNYGKQIKGVKAETKITLTITGEESGAVEKTILEIDTSRRWGRRSADSWWTAIKEGKNGIYTLTLDDITTQGRHFADIFTDFIPGENIIIEAEASSTNVLCTPVKAQTYTNSLFAEKHKYEDGDSTASQVTISNIRHLQNLCPVVSNLPTEASAGADGVNAQSIIKKAEQTSSLDWDDFRPDGRGTNRVVYSYDRNTSHQRALATDAFYGIFNPALKIYEGNGNTLSDFQIQENENGNAGLFAQIGANGMTIQNLTLQRFVSESNAYQGNAGTLIGAVMENGRFTGRNIFVVNATVKAGYNGNAGGLAGNLENGNLEYCGVYLTEDEDSVGGTLTAAQKYENGAYNSQTNLQGRRFLASSSSGAAGGLAGKVSNTEIKNSFASIPVSAGENGAAGGFIGKIEGTWDSNTLIESSYSGGYTKSGEYSEFYGSTALGWNGVAGGFIGQDTVQSTTVRNSFSTVSVYGNVSGGFVGRKEQGSAYYQDCYAAGTTEGIDGNSKKGAFLGENWSSANISASNSYGLKSSGQNQSSFIWGISDVSYKELQNAMGFGNESGREIHNYDPSLTGAQYPFALVTNAGAESPSASKVYYGDWGKESVESTGSIGLVYYEIVDGQLYYHGYTAQFSANGAQPEYEEIAGKGEGLVNGLLTDSGKYVSEEGYLILVPQGSDTGKILIQPGTDRNGNGPVWTLAQATETFAHASLFQMEGYDPYYFSEEVGTWCLGYLKLGINVGEWSWVQQFGDYTSFAFNPYFADSVAEESVNDNKLRIRSARHLQNANSYQFSGNQQCELIQLFDINYENQDFTKNGKDVTYAFSTIGTMFADYTVQKYGSTGETGDYSIRGLKVSMFGYIGNSATIRGVNLEDIRVESSGGFAVQNDGTIENCGIRPAVEGSAGYAEIKITSGDGGAGFVRYNSGTIRNSYFSGIVTGDKVAGFVFQNQGTIENSNVRPQTAESESYSAVIIEAVNEGSGFVRYNNGTIRNSYFSGIVTGEKIAGFVFQNQGTIENSNVRPQTAESESYSAVIIEAVNEGSGFVRYNNGTIRNSYFSGIVTGDQASGFVFQSYGTIENSYASAIVTGNSRAAGFVFSASDRLVNSFVTGLVSSGEDGTSYGFVAEGNSPQMENCYSALFWLSGKYIYRFGTGRGSNYTNCVWLDVPYYEGELLPGNPYDLRLLGEGKTYEEMAQEGTNPETHKYNSNYENVDKEGEVYPFSLSASADVESGIPFWGDWPKQDLEPDTGLIYYEIVEGQIYYHGYLTKSCKADENPVYQEIMTQGYEETGGLLEEQGKYVTEDGYMILLRDNVDENSIGILYGTDTSKKLETATEQVDETILSYISQVQGFQGYYISQQEIPEELYENQMMNIQVGENLGKEKAVVLDERTARFSFQPLFGDSVRGYDEENTIFAVRSARQLENIDKDGSPENLTFVQSADITYEKEKVSYTERGKDIAAYEFTASIDGFSSDFESKMIGSDEKTYGYVIEGLDKNLFGTIETESTVRGVTLVNGNASFAEENKGVIDSCAVRSDTMDEDSYENEISEEPQPEMEETPVIDENEIEN